MEEYQEFKDFASTGLAAKISNLQNIYAMYLNVLEKKGVIKPQHAQQKPPEESKTTQPKAKPSKQSKARVKETADVDDDLAFLEQAI